MSAKFPRGGGGGGAGPFLARSLITCGQCLPITIELGNICQTSHDARKIGALPACQRNAIRMAFRWRADSCLQLDSGWAYSRIINQIKTSLSVAMGNDKHEWAIRRMYNKTNRIDHSM